MFFVLLFYFQASIKKINYLFTFVFKVDQILLIILVLIAKSHIFIGFFN